MVRLAASLLVLALALSACGGGDDSKDAQQAVRDFVEATNDHDGDRLCGDLLSQDYLEKYTGATGDRADDACKQQLTLITGLKLRLVSIDGTKVDDDKATVRVTIAMRGENTPRVFRLVKQDGDWKLDSGS
jgi:ABC-type glycerol-3-phosphate transport system substrate-binding protein